MGLLGACWGFAGVFLLIGFAVVRLTPIAVDALDYPFAWYHWLALVVNILFMLHAEGYKGFQQNFSPRVAVRCRHLYHHPTLLHVLLAPMFAMCYFHTTPRQQRVSLMLTGMIICMVIMVGYLPQPLARYCRLGRGTGFNLGPVVDGLFCDQVPG